MYTARNNVLQGLIKSGRRAQALELSGSLLECLHIDLWAARASRDAVSLATLVKMANRLRDASVLAKPFGRESLDGLRRYSMRRAQEQGLELRSSKAPRLFGRPRWLYRHALDAEVRYRWSRLTEPTEVWLGHLIEAANAWGRVKGARAAVTGTETEG